MMRRETVSSREEGRRTTKWIALFGAIVASSVVWIIAGCDMSDPAPTPVPVPTPQELVIAIDDDRGGNFNPYSANPSPILRFLSGSLLRADSRGRLHEKLADRVEISGSTLVVDLNPNAQFSDGTPVTAADVVASLNAHADKHVSGPNVAALEAFGYDGAVVDGRQVKVKFKQMQADAQSFVAQVGIWPKALVESIQQADAPQDAKIDWRKLAGAGAYRIREFEPGNYALLAPIAQGAVIRVRTIEDKETARAEFAAGHVHLTYAEPRRQEMFRRIPGATVMPYEYPMPVTLAMNMEAGTPTQQSAELRKAIAMATNIEPLRKLVAKEGSAPAGGRLFLGSIDDWNHPDCAKLVPGYDPAAAGRLLDDKFPVRDGVRRKADGTPLRLVILSYKSTEYPQLAERLAQEWKQHLQVEAVAGVVAPGEFNDVVNRQSRNQGPGDWHVLLEEWPHELAPFTPSRGAGLLSPAVPPKGDNLIGLNDTKIDEWVRDADHCIDPAKRRDLYRQIHQYMLEQNYILPLYVVYDSWVVRPEVAGIAPDDPLVRHTIFVWPETLGLSRGDAKP